MNKPKLIFFNRAYNDLDMQLPLIRECAQAGFDVQVLGYPCDGDLGTPQDHEAAPYIKEQYNVRFETILDESRAPKHLKILYRLRRFFEIRKKTIGRSFYKAGHVACLMALRFFLKQPQPWIDTITKTWAPVAVFIDEACLHAKRSDIIDRVLPKLVARGIHLYVIQTGQHIYKNAIEDLNLDRIAYKTEKANRFFVAGQLDQEICQKLYPQENIEKYGNLRMDRRWIDTLHNEALAPPYFDKEFFMQQLPTGKPKIVFMLSKLNYGTPLEAIQQTIQSIASMQGVGFAIKPHTRSMKFDFVEQEHLQDVVIADGIPSSLLIEWADILLFTGSGIAFHALTLGKRAGFLAYCQDLETVFDEGPACDIFQSKEELENFIRRLQDEKGTQSDKNIARERQNWLKHVVHNNDPAGNTAQSYKDAIIRDLGLDFSIKPAKTAQN